MFHANGNQKKARVTIPISDKIDFKIKYIIRDKEGHYIMIKESIKEEDIAIVNIHAPNIGASQYIRQTLTGIRRDTDSNTIIVWDFTTSLTWMDRSSKQRNNKKTQTLNETLGQMDLIDIFKIFHPNAEEYTFFWSAHGTFSRLDHILGDKSSLSKLKKIEIVSSIFSDQNAMILDISYRKNLQKTNSWRLNNILLNNKDVTEDIRKEIQKFLETNETENMTTQNLWDWEEAVLRGKFIAIQSYLKKQEKHWIGNITLYLKQLEKESS